MTRALRVVAAAAAVALLALAGPVAAQTPGSVPAGVLASDTLAVDSLSAARTAPSVAALSATALSVAADSTGAPARALRRSLLVPGWGQATNGQVAKVPVIAAALAGTAAVLAFQQRRYVRYRRSAFWAGCLEVPGRDVCADLTDADQQAWLATGSPSRTQAENTRNITRGRRDLSVLGLGVVYALQALDAYVAAQLIGFDVSEDVAVRAAPGGLALRVRL